MSGFLSLVNTDGAPVEATLVEALTMRLAPRGPDAQRFWCQAQAGLGHALLSVSDDDEGGDGQPVSLDGETWLVADARVDAQDDLRAMLKDAGRAVGRATDAELLLQAWHAWGDACVHRIVGDFAFVVWNARTRSLFGARDRFGVRPFFYAAANGVLVAASEIGVVGSHPEVPETLDDLWIADFLLFKRSLRPEASVFEAIRRLPGGHTLSWSREQGLQVRRYVRGMRPEPIRFRRREEYVERFQELFDRAVGDRLRTRRIAVSMSGGLDSSFIAATAKRLLSARGGSAELCAHTMVYDHLIPDDERGYASVAAAEIGIPVTFLSADDFDALSPGQGALAEPQDLSFHNLHAAFCARAGQDARAVFSGMDADSLLGEFLPDHYRGMLRAGQGGALLRQMAEYVSVVGQRPPIGARAAAARLLGRNPDATPDMPAWVSTDLSARLDLANRWEVYWAGRRGSAPLRPRAVRSMALWERVFEYNDPAVMHQPLEFLYPFADARLVDYLLAIPAAPWCADKTLIRLAARGVLPERVRVRAKTPVRVDVRRLWLSRPDASWVDRFDASEKLAVYVDRRRVPPVTGAHATAGAHVHLRPFFLNDWLPSARRAKLTVEKSFKGAERVKGSEVESVA